MYKSKIAVCAESVVLDQLTQQVSVFNIIDAVLSHGFPIAINKLTLLFAIAREESDPIILDALVVATLAGTELMRHPVQINFLEKFRANQIIAFQGLVLTGPGLLKFSLLQGETEISTIELGVTGPAVTSVPGATLS